MRGDMVLSNLNRRGLAAASLFLSLIRLFDTANAIPTISVTGSKLYDTDGNQFYVRGVFYEVDPDDNALASTEQCKIDARLMKEVGINTVRVRNVEGSLDSRHDGCMSAFEDAGIYALVHLHSGSTGVDTVDPKWNEFLFNNFAGIVDTFAKYDNLLGYMVDNVKTSAAGSNAGPYIKAAVSDMKIYRDSKGYRNFPIGYLEGYDSDISLAKYLTCGDEAVDFYGTNGDVSCSSISDATDSLVRFSREAIEFNTPVFEGNIGCPNTDTIVEHEKVLDSNVSRVMSGGSIYNWVDFESSSAPHLVNFPDDEIKKKPITPKKNSPYYSDLQKVWKESKPSSTAKSDYTPPTKAAACPSSDGDWAAALGRPLPTFAGSLTSTSASAPRVTNTAAPSATDTDTAKPDARPSGVAGQLKSDDDSTGIVTSVKIAIGVIIPVVIIIVLTAIFFIYRRRRRRRRQQPRPEQELPAISSITPKKEPQTYLQCYEKEQPLPLAELDQWAGVAPKKRPARELERQVFVVELEDTSPAMGDARNVYR